MTTNENKQNDERTAFEAWANVEGFDVKRGIHRDNYAGAITESLWAAWQARATQQATTGDERAEIERCAKICESVMEQSRNHLFRSAAKICAMSIRNPTQPCDRAPEGWMCSRIAGHEGPCAASQITKEWCVKMAAVEPEEGVPPAGLAALDDSATVIPVSPEELAKMFTPSPVAGSQKPYGYFSMNGGSSCSEVDPKWKDQADVFPLFSSPVMGSAGQAPIYQVSDGASWNDTDWLEFQSTPAEDRRIVHEVSGDGSGVSLPTINTVRLPDGSGFAVASLPLPKDHWLYAARCAEWDEERDTTADTPHPILSHGQRDAVVAAVRYAVRGATMCGKESDFDPDALVQNAVYALCGPYGGVMEISTPAAPSLATDAGAVITVGQRQSIGLAISALESKGWSDQAAVLRALLAAHPEQRMSDAAIRPAKSHCQNGGDVCLAGNRDGVCCPEDSCDIDDGTRKNPIDAACDAKDAARYRWLRKQVWNKSSLFVVACHHSAIRLGTNCPSDERLDDAIDAARNAEIERGDES